MKKPSSEIDREKVINTDWVSVDLQSSETDAGHVTSAMDMMKIVFLTSISHSFSPRVSNTRLVKGNKGYSIACRTPFILLSMICFAPVSVVCKRIGRTGVTIIRSSLLFLFFLFFSFFFFFSRSSVMCCPSCLSIFASPPPPLSLPPETLPFLSGQTDSVGVNVKQRVSLASLHRRFDNNYTGLSRLPRCKCMRHGPAGPARSSTGPGPNLRLSIQRFKLWHTR